MVTEKKSEKIEREYVIPLREKCRPVPRYKKTPKAIKSIKEFLVRHMKIRDRDLKKIKLDNDVNEVVWARGIKKPVNKVAVKAVKEGDIVRVSLANIPKKLADKKKRLEKRENKVQSKVTPKMTPAGSSAEENKTEAPEGEGETKEETTPKEKKEDSKPITKKKTATKKKVAEKK